MSDTRPWVLVSEGGSGESRAALAAVRALAAGGYRPAVTVSGDLSLAAASRHCERRVEVPPVATQPDAYAAAVRAELVRLDYVDVLACSDLALLALDRPGRNLMDKEEVAQTARDAGFDVPPSRVFSSVDELHAARHDLPYPIVVKPAIKHFLATRVEAAEGLPTRVPAQTRLLVQPWIDEPLRGVLGVMWDGDLVLAAHLRYTRVWPYPCGTVSAAETVGPDDGLEASLGRLLADYSGLFHVDLAGSHLLDVNLRVHAATPAAQAAGVNLPAGYCDLVRGARVRPNRARAGVRYRWEEGDLRSLIRLVGTGAMTRGQALDALRPRRRTAHSVVRLSDPAPALMRARYLARRVRRPEPIRW